MSHLINPNLCPTIKRSVILRLATKIQQTQISVPIYSLHRDPETFADPDTWNPDRWSLPTTSPTYKQMLRSLIPFGTGARMCTGMKCVSYLHD